MEDRGRFAGGVANWTQGLGKVRDAVRQELVTRQLTTHLLPAGPQVLKILDAGCGQGTQALALARLGHNVVGVDLSEEPLDLALEAAASEPNEVRRRLRFA